MRMSEAEAVRRGIIPEKDRAGSVKEPCGNKVCKRKLDALKHAKVTLWESKKAIVLTSDIIPISLNHIVSMHPMVWTKYANTWKRLVFEAVLESNLKNKALAHAFPVIYIYKREGRNLLDLDNIIIKPIIDGLVISGVYQDDSPDIFHVPPFSTQVQLKENSREFPDEGMKIYFYKRKDHYQNMLNHVLTRIPCL